MVKPEYSYGGSSEEYKSLFFKFFFEKSIKYSDLITNNKVGRTYSSSIKNISDSLFFYEFLYKKKHGRYLGDSITAEDYHNEVEEGVIEESVGSETSPHGEVLNNLGSTFFSDNYTQ